MSDILGYTKLGKTIRPTKSGVITSAACIRCDQCGASIKSMGGPEYGAICAQCATHPIVWDAIRYRALRNLTEGVSYACTFNGNTGASTYEVGEEVDKMADSIIKFEGELK